MGQYEANKHPKTDSEKLLLESVTKYLNELKASGGDITPKKWTAEKISKNAEQLAKTEKQQDKPQMER